MVLALSHALQVPCVAVGVETRAQFDWLRAHQCEYAQGRFFGPAVPPEQLVERLSRADGERHAG